MNLAQELIAKWEGLRLTAYKDTLDKWTIGFGHLLLPQDKDWTGYTITQDQADAYLASDMHSAVDIANTFPYFSSMNEVRQAALISMAYQLGTKPLHWPMFMASLGIEDYAGAAAAGLDSLWARETPTRANEEMAMLKSGVLNA
jgi:lysozyme